MTNPEGKKAATYELHGLTLVVNGEPKAATIADLDVDRRRPRDRGPCSWRGNP